jgi:hypothetical protein
MGIDLFPKEVPASHRESSVAYSHFPLSRHCRHWTHPVLWGFSRAFSSVVRQMPGWYPQRRGTVRTLPNFFVALCIFCVVLCICCVVLCIVCFVTFPVLFVCICVLKNCHRVATQLQLNISYHVIVHRNSQIFCAHAVVTSSPIGIVSFKQFFNFYYLHPLILHFCHCIIVKWLKWSSELTKVKWSELRWRSCG